VREVGGFYSEGDRVATALLPPHKMKAMDTTVPISGGRLHMRIDGTPGVPPLLFCNALGTTLHLWDGQEAAVVDRALVIRYDARGHGRSTVVPGEYALDDLGRDALAVLDAAGVERAVVAGISLGG
jgi:pimeloyl-ACP methyl ester carboxylesterase